MNEVDDDAAHLDVLLPLMQRKDLPDYVKAKIGEHIEMHIKQMGQKEAQKSAEQRKAEQQGDMLNPTGGVPGQDRAPAAGGLAAQPGVTPGPQQSRTVARTGREGAGISQTQSMGEG